jgi:hypothetical protein
MLVQSQKRQLDDLGYLVLPGFVPPPLLAELRERVEAVWELEGDDAGSEFRPEPGTRRLANLVDKGAVFADLVAMQEILECIEHVIGPNYKLSSFNARSANPHNAESQPLHVDAGAVADESGYWVCNTIWMLDDFTAENGATRMIPRSHAWRCLPEPGITQPDTIMSRNESSGGTEPRAVQKYERRTVEWRHEFGAASTLVLADDRRWLGSSPSTHRHRIPSG